MSQNRMNEVQLKKRFTELANRAFQKNQFVFSEFLTLEEQSILLSMKKELSFSKVFLFGGTENVERKVARFGDEEELGYEENFPISIIEVTPLSAKFAQTLSHRDYLGAVMNLGIIRNQIGDILIQEKTAYIFVISNMKEYIMEGLSTIGHTHVKCKEIETIPSLLENNNIKEERIIVNSLRVDGVIAHVYHLSRSQSILLFAEHKVFVNDRLIEGNSTLLKENDRISVRGFGRFLMPSSIERTKKEKYMLFISKYI